MRKIDKYAAIPPIRATPSSINHDLPPTLSSPPPPPPPPPKQQQQQSQQRKVTSLTPHL